MMKREELTYEERMLYMPLWEKILLFLFFVSMPFIISIVDFSF